MKIELDYVEVIEKLPIKYFKTNAGKEFYQHQMNIKQKNNVVTLIIRTYNKEVTKKITESVQSDLKKEKPKKEIK